MTWLVLALAAVALWAIVNLIDDNMIRDVYPSVNFAVIISGLYLIN